MKNLGKWGRWFAMCAAMGAMALGGCAALQPKAETPAPAPAPAPDQPSAGTPTTPKLAYRPSKDAAAVIEISDAGLVRFFNADTGKKLPSCQLCSPALEEKYGPKCMKAAETQTSICQGSVGGTVFNFEQVAVTRSRVNPYCMVFYSGGRMIQGPCYCKVGEVVPPGIVCSVWVP
ncbi:MAG: hypothetical protein K2X67_01440 [Burkholderiales bacterium]|nr:hypothetical protein [Burkholderiales bacterium]